MILFNTEVPLKTHGCSFNGNPTDDVEPFVNVFVRITDRCNANCGFCAFKKDFIEDVAVDIYKFFYALSQIRKNVRIEKVSITGGEPTLAVQNIIKIVEMIKDVDKNIFIVLSTNGTNLNKIPAETLNNIGSIALSRHHFDEKTNNEIFGVPNSLFSVDDIKAFPMKEKLHLSCNLVKGFIDSQDKVYTYIQTMAKLGVSDFGFVSLMGVNEFCKDNFVDFKDISIDTMQNTIVNKKWAYKNDCRCNNYLTFTDDGTIVKLYARYYVNRDKCESTLVYDRHHLKIGFTGETIFNGKATL